MSTEVVLPLPIFHLRGRPHRRELSGVLSADERIRPVQGALSVVRSDNAGQPDIRAGQTPVSGIVPAVADRCVPMRLPGGFRGTLVTLPPRESAMR